MTKGDRAALFEITFASHRFDRGSGAAQMVIPPPPVDFTGVT